VTDYAGQRWLTTQELRLVNGTVNRQRRIVTSSMGMTDNNGTVTMDQSGAVAAIQRGMALQPERLLLTAADNRGALTALRPTTFRGEQLDGVRYAVGQDTMNLWFDRPTGRLLVSEALTDDGVLGDRRTLTWYTRWQDAGGLMLPRQIDTEVNGRVLAHNVVGAITINQTLDEAAFVIPDSLAARAPRGPATPPVITVNLVQLAPSIWRAEGGSHHSLVVEQGQSLLVVEGPQSSARTKAVLDTLRSRMSGRTISAVVATHHHHDHSGGLREYLAQGIPVIAHSRNVTFVQTVGAARKTVAPDGLSRGGRVPPVRAVSDTLVLGSGPGQVVLYPIESAHVEGILAAWVPSAGIVFTSDILSPVANQPLAKPGSVELVTFARQNGLNPRQYVGGHGVVVEWSAVETAAR
jgi:glyoxylase-like metal-dependent hydrolase (beta-lactamase superfamily II)